MRITTIIISFIFISLSSVKAQQDAMFSQYMFDKMIVNPAFTGSSNWAVGTVKHRSQFVGLPGAPNTQSLTGEFPILLRNMGVGLKVINDNIGVIHQSSFTGLFAYHMKVKSGKLSLGLETGMISQSINFTNLLRTDAADNALPEGKQSVIVYDASFGSCFQTKSFYVGLSAFHLTRSKLTFQNASNSVAPARLFNHNYLIIGNVFKLNNDFALEPSILLKNAAGAPLELDVNLMTHYQKKLSAGLSYRTGDALVLLFKFNANENFRIGYSYDMTLSQLSSYSSGAHEILLSYSLELYARYSNPIPRY